MRTDRRGFIVSSAAGLLEARRISGGAALDASAARADFPAAGSEAYLNTPYIGPVPRPVEQAGIDFVRSKAENPTSLGAMLEKTNEARRKFAELRGL